MRVLEVNDAGLRISDGERVLANSPGYAASEGRMLHVGEAARRRQRLDPRRCHDRFWYQLDASLAAVMAQARSAADLAHAHLVSLGTVLTEQPLLVAAPGSFTTDQLGILLGLLQACGARARGLFDPAAAAASMHATRERVIHVEAQLHRFVISELAGTTRLARTNVQESKPGLTAVQDRCAAVIAKAFVAQSRFDPLHSAATEQLLYDALPGWLQALARGGSPALELEAGGRRQRATVDGGELRSALAPRVDELADLLRTRQQATGSTLLIGARAAEVPGLCAALPGALVLDELDVACGALAHADAIASQGSELAWVTALPRRALSTNDEDNGGDATHVLVGARAQPLPRNGQPLALSSWLPGAPGLLRREDGELWLEGADGGSVRVNGQACARSVRLQLGDRLGAVGLEARLIAVQDQ